jgi:hypothetical protein
MNLFILFFSDSIYLALVTNDDHGGEIFGARYGGAMSVGA